MLIAVISPVSGSNVLNHPSLKSRIQGSGEMAELIRAKNWGSTPLGPIDTWSETLVAAVNILLFTPFPSAIYWGPSLTLLYNDAYRPILAGKHPSALGSLGADVWAEAWPTIGPPIEGSFSNGAITRATEAFVPILVDGQLVDRWWSWGLYPIYEGNTIAGVGNTCNDETPSVLARQDQLQAEQARDRITSQLEQILNGTTDGIALVDRNWRYTYFNRAGREIAQVDESVIGKNIWEAFPGMVYPDSPYIFHHTRAMDEGIPGSFVTPYSSLSITDLEVHSLPVPDGIVILFRDITRQRREVESLLQTEKLAAVGRLASTVAHEINNPLESVTNLLYLMRTSDVMEEIQNYVATAERELRRVSIITNQTLRFHKQANNPTAAFCQDLIGESLSIYQGRLVNSNIEVEKRKRATHPIECFTGEIRQVLSNLIGNAIDAMPHGGRLILRSHEMTDHKTGKRGIVLTVADTGTGMSPTTQRRIFEPFFSTKGIGGTGLGLWVSAEIVERHSGILMMRSSQKPEAHGTVFALFLPFDAVTRTSTIA